MAHFKSSKNSENHILDIIQVWTEKMNLVQYNVKFPLSYIYINKCVFGIHNKKLHIAIGPQYKNKPLYKQIQ